MAGAINGPARDGAFWRDLLLAQYSQLERVIRWVARRYRLSREEADELGSAVRCKLVEDDYAVLRQFEGRSHLATYLTTVASHVCLDLRIARWGKWRASVAARRLGTTAIRLERLTGRDGLSFDEACQMLKTNFRVSESVAELRAMRQALPARERPRAVDPAVLDALPAPRTVEADAADDRKPAVSPQLRGRLARALAALPDEDRRLVKLRFKSGWTVARVASELGLNQKATYREFDRILRTLRSSLGSTPTSTVGAVYRHPAPALLESR